jgi:hypothetical protein
VVHTNFGKYSEEFEIKNEQDFLVAEWSRSYVPLTLVLMVQKYPCSLSCNSTKRQRRTSWLNT